MADFCIQTCTLLHQQKCFGKLESHCRFIYAIFHSLTMHYQLHYLSSLPISKLGRKITNCDGLATQQMLQIQRLQSTTNTIDLSR